MISRKDVISKIKNFLHMTKKQKLRFFVYLIIIICLFVFILPEFETYFTKTSVAVESNKSNRTVSRKYTKPQEKKDLNNIKVAAIITAAKGVVLSKEESSKTWTVIDKGKNIVTGVSFATLPGSSLLFNLPGRYNVGLPENSELMLQPGEANDFLYVLSKGCVGIQLQNKSKTFDFNVSVNGEIKKNKVNKDSVFCLSPDDENKYSDTGSFFLTADVFEESYLDIQALSPCNGDITDAGSVKLDFVSPALISKEIVLSGSEAFENIIFRSSSSGNSVTTSTLSPGIYYWKVYDKNMPEHSSKVCKFEIKAPGNIKLIMPDNNDILIDGVASFSWNAVEGSNEYTLTITRDIQMNSVVFSEKTKSTVIRIDDIFQTLGPGKYFWFVGLPDGKRSTIRQFSLYSENELVLIKPADASVVKPADFFRFTWKALPSVRTYSIVVASNPSFNNVIHADTGPLPVSFMKDLTEGDYFLRLSALFDSNRKLNSKVYKFSVMNISELKVNYPLSNSVVAYKPDKKGRNRITLQWEKYAQASGYEITLNGNQPFINSAKFSNLSVDINKGLNTLQIKALCGNKICSQSGKIEFTAMPDTAPVLLSPREGKAVSVDKRGRIEFKWHKSDKNIEYQLSPSSEFIDDESLVYGSSSVGRAKVQTNVVKDRVYFRLREEGGIWGKVYNFYVLPQRPGIPVIVAPYHRKVTSRKKKIVFEWKETRGAEGYLLEISGSKKFKKKKEYKVSDLSFKKRLPKGKWYWRLRSFDTVNGKLRYSKTPRKPRLLIVKYY